MIMMILFCFLCGVRDQDWFAVEGSKNAAGTCPGVSSLLSHLQEPRTAERLVREHRSHLTRQTSLTKISQNTL